ncbi:MAG: hypothetical protein ACRCYU_16920 [Nocardioides sp.]
MSAARRVALIPGPLALCLEYASFTDPVARLRKAVAAAMAWLDEGAGPAGEIAVYCTGQQLRLAEELLAKYGRTAGTWSDLSAPGDDAARPGRRSSVLAIANGSACRTERAPGFLDSRATAFDARVEAALREPDIGALRGLDEALAAELLADVEALRSLGEDVLTDSHHCTVDYSDDPFGVQYWVMRWELPDGA